MFEGVTSPLCTNRELFWSLSYPSSLIIENLFLSCQPGSNEVNIALAAASVRFISFHTAASDSASKGSRFRKSSLHEFRPPIIINPNNRIPIFLILKIPICNFIIL